MQAGDVIFFKGKSFIAKIIMWLTKSEYSHVGLVVDDEHIIESDRFKRTEIVSFKIDHNTHKIFRLSGDVPCDKIVEHAKSLIGTDYDYLQILTIFMRTMFGFRVNFEQTNKMICSEVIDRAFYLAGVPRKNIRPLGNVTPQDLFDIYDLNMV